MSERVGNGLCAACLLALALDGDGDEYAAATVEVLSAEYRVLTVLRGDDRRTTYLVEEEGRGGLFTLDVVRAAACPGTTASLFAARVERLCALRHPAIASVVGGAPTSEGDYSVVAEYVAGQGLDLFSSRPSTERTDILGLFETLCDAVASAHALGVVHGELHASSVVLRMRAGCLIPKITGYSVCAAPAVPGDDVAGLEEILAALTKSTDAAARLGSMVRGCPSVEALRRAVRQAWPATPDS